MTTEEKAALAAEVAKTIKTRADGDEHQIISLVATLLLGGGWRVKLGD